VAQVHLVDSQHAATAAVAVARRANQRLGGAQEQVGQLAAETYRSGGSVASLDVLLSPSGPDQVLERITMMHTLAGQRQDEVQHLDAARVVATTLGKQADEAVVRQADAARKLAAARAVAQQRSAAVRSIMTAETAVRGTLLAKLAAARRTTVAVERARQAGLAQAALLRQQEQRRQAAARAAASQRASSSTGSSGGASGSASGYSGSPALTGGGSSGSSSSGQSAVSWAEHRVGLPYQWGGAGPGSYDCSGLTMRAWEQAGVSMPHSAAMQYEQVSKVSYGSMRPGDLVFYATNTSNPNTIHHVAMYVGGGQMIEAPHTGANVRIVSLREGGDAMAYAGRP
jgi:cell wall-associated NlpC family hydrolase